MILKQFGGDKLVSQNWKNKIDTLPIQFLLKTQLIPFQLIQSDLNWNFIEMRLNKIWMGNV